MSNSYFQFKQFKVEQDRCAMKVTTDACIQGAWTPIPATARRALDIGAGTGLLSLMLAQRAPQLNIDAVELDEQAAQQAGENVANADISERISVIAGDIQNVALQEGLYDLIISNPPFFNNSLLGDVRVKNRARHTLTLGYDGLAAATRKCLATEGAMSILLPPPEYDLWLMAAGKEGLYPFHELRVRHRPNGKMTRVIGLMSHSVVAEIRKEELIINGEDGQYSPAFRSLLAPFYLHL